MARGICIKPPFDLNKFPEVEIANGDANNYTVSGMYYFAGNAQNVPTGAYGVLITITIGRNPPTTTQFWLPVWSPRIYMRRKYQGTWEIWYRITLTEETS